MNRLIKSYEEYVIPRGLIINIDDKVIEKDKINDISYGPSYDKSWFFEQPLDDSEWRLRSIKKIKRWCN